MVTFGERVLESHQHNVVTLGLELHGRPRRYVEPIDTTHLHDIVLDEHLMEFSHLGNRATRTSQAHI